MEKKRGRKGGNGGEGAREMVLCVSFYSRRLYNENPFSLKELLNIKDSLKRGVAFETVSSSCHSF